MLGRVVVACSMVGALGGTVAAAEFDPKAAHAQLIDAFNNRQWAAVKEQLADDAVFHRANATEVYSGPDAILGHFEKTIGGEWNVKFAKLDSEDQFTGKDGRVVERGDFAITAGADHSECYAGSYMAAWAPDGDARRLQQLAWQTVETDLANCQQSTAQTGVRATKSAQ